MNFFINFFIILLVILIIFYCFFLIDKLENFQNNKETLQFIHIPKNAGTSIENLGNKFGIKWGRFIEREKYPLSEKPCDYYHWHSPYFIRQKNTKYFAIVRNPYDKIISEFYYVGGQKDERYASDNHLKSFYLWLDDKYKIIKSNKHWNNCHILPQHEYIFDSTGKKRIDHVVYMDKDFKVNLDKLFKQYNLDIDIDELNKNNSREKTFSKNDINQNALNKINEMYSEDFKKLGFTKLSAGIENFTNKRDLDYYEDFNSNERLTLVFGYWEVKENKKHNIQHYEENIKKTFSLLKNYDIIFFHNNDNYVNMIKDVIDKSNNITFIKRKIEDLPAYKFSNKLLKLCKDQNNNLLKNMNNGNEKGLIHYDRELKNGDNNYKKIMTIWFSKLYLVKECIEKNYYNNKKIAWCDISITKLPNNILKNTNFYELDNKNNKIFIFNNLMKYRGSKLIIGAAYIQSNKIKFMEFIKDFVTQFEKLNDNYCHDEETLMNLVYNKNKKDFVVLNAWIP